MFTGIIESIGEIREKTENDITITRPQSFDDIKTGCSIAVSGVCLSVINLNNDFITFDVIPETFKKTNLGDLSQGDHVNLERALSASGRFDGHIVQGHVEGVGCIEAVEKEGDDALLTVSIPDTLMRFIIPKGSITLDGVSLTVASLSNNTCSVALIPHTLASTTLGTMKKGDTLNIETDMIGRYIATLLPTQ